MIDKLSFFRGSADGGTASAEEERLMQLFQNRAGLKKAYADLKDEFHLQRDRLKQQEGATIRVQEQLDALGDLLADPKTGYSALVFFQLRALWKTCHAQLAAFTGELTKQQEARELAKHQADVEEGKRARLSEANERLQAAAAEADAQRQQLGEAQRELARLTAFWHYFKRRRVQRAIEVLRNQVIFADGAVGDLHAECSAIANEAEPPFPGISLQARRTINLAIISYAEMLCESVDAFGLAARAKEAVARRVHDMSFGARAECEGYMQRVQQSLAAVTQHKAPPASLKGRLERLRAGCSFRNSLDTVPSAESLGNRAGGAPPWNVLADDYWDVYSLLLR